MRANATLGLVGDEYDIRPLPSPPVTVEYAEGWPGNGICTSSPARESEGIRCTSIAACSSGGWPSSPPAR